MKNHNFLNKFLVMVLVITMVISFSMTSQAADGKADSLSLTILHTNDIHGRVDEGRFDGMGFAKLATIVNDFRGKNDNVLLLDAGDTVHGLPIANFSQGETIIRIMNELGYDYMVAGNHDFNYGYQRLIELEEMADFPIFAGNVVYEETQKPIIEKEYDIIEIDGYKIAIFGIATPETLYKSHPIGTVGLDFLNPVDYAQGMMNHLNASYDDIDFVIALTHLGIDESTKYEERSTAVAEQVEGIDLIVDGHSHDLLPQGMMVGDTMIVQAEEYGKNLGVVEIVIENGEITMEASVVTKEEAEDIEEDPTVKALIDELKSEREEVLEIVIGQNLRYLDGSRETVRTRESNLGNLLTDAMLFAAPEADIALTNGGGIRSSIGEGEITIGHVEQVLPFGNQLVIIELTGAEIVAALEHGAGDYPAEKGAFPHVAGISYSIDPSKPQDERIFNVLVDGQPIALDHTYLVATNDFLAAGGDAYTMFAEAPVYRELYDLAEVLVEYISLLEEVDYAVEGRITVGDSEAIINDPGTGNEETEKPITDEEKDSNIDDESGEQAVDEDETEKVVPPGESKNPKTGDRGIVIYVLMAAASAGVIYTNRKYFKKAS